MTFLHKTNEKERLKNDLNNAKKLLTELEVKMKFLKSKYRELEDTLKERNRRLSYLEKQDKLMKEYERFKENFINVFYNDMVNALINKKIEFNFGNILEFIKTNSSVAEIFKYSDIDKARKIRNRIAHPYSNERIPEEELLFALEVFEKYNNILDEYNKDRSV